MNSFLLDVVRIDCRRLYINILVLARGKKKSELNINISEAGCRYIPYIIPYIYVVHLFM